MIAGPISVSRCASVLAQPPDEIAIGVEHADRRHVAHGQTFVAARFAQQVSRLEGGCFRVVLVGQYRHGPVAVVCHGVVGSLARPCAILVMTAPPLTSLTS